MHGTLLSEGTTSDATRAVVLAHVRDQQFFWLDLDGIDDEAQALLLDDLDIHRLAVEDVQEFGQRPKFEDYDNFSYLVVHGAGTGSSITDEVHFLLADHYVITVHRGACAALDQVRARFGHRRSGDPGPPNLVLLYLIMDQLVDSFFPLLDGFDTQIDDLEDAILVRPTDEQLGTLFGLKRTLISVRKVVTPERDMFASLSSGVTQLPGMTAESQRYMRDLYDHLIRISDLVDGYRDLLSGVMDTHLSTVSNRLNVVMKQLTIIATVFLPLSFLTGFFGQNFSWLVAHITGWWPFVIFGLGLEVAAAAALLYVFRKRGWFGGPTT
jgi:magnesium transporter